MILHNHKPSAYMRYVYKSFIVEQHYMYQIFCFSSNQDSASKVINQMQCLLLISLQKLNITMSVTSGEAKAYKLHFKSALICELTKLSNPGFYTIEINNIGNRVSIVLGTPQQPVFTENPGDAAMGRATFRYAIIPIQLPFGFSLVVQGNNESQWILPAERDKCSVSENEKETDLCKSTPSSCPKYIQTQNQPQGLDGRSIQLDMDVGKQQSQ